MIINLLKGGLGNQLFQYAAGKALSLFHCTEHALDISNFGTSTHSSHTLRNLDIFDFNIHSKVASEGEIESLRPSDSLFFNKVARFTNKFIKKYYIDWRPEIFFAGKNLYLDGYFQSEKYFCNYISVIRDEFSLLEDYKFQASEILSSIRSEKISISIHIRRGDYVNNKRIQHIYDVCTWDYYKHAINMMLEKFPEARFFVFTDDQEWVKDKLFTCPRLILVSGMSNISGDMLRPSQELFLMSQCNHHIIANSSFSWWGAYLNDSLNKIVIAPDVWNRSKFFPQKNVVPSNWLRLPVHGQ